MKLYTLSLSVESLSGITDMREKEKQQPRYKKKKVLFETISTEIKDINGFITGYYLIFHLSFTTKWAVQTTRSQDLSPFTLSSVTIPYFQKGSKKNYRSVSILPYLLKVFERINSFI